ncbi:60S ribosomal export protein NMD3 [Methanoculleus chikugoensis]|uniref:NMD3-related protein n=1 Tax=Methanoculleus chikugoensis TaxID=118126 RepID=UPI001FB370CD|nr:NMD3-related protein [Methanoculleus chikugoensis]
MREAERGRILPECRAADVRLLTCEPHVTTVYCPVCESQKRGKTWSDLQMPPHVDRITELAVSAVSIHEDAKDIRITVRSEDIASNRTACTVEVEASLYGVPVRETCSTEIRWQKESCDRCSRISGGGYYEGGIVQVRATGRKINAYEREVAASLAQQVEESLQQSGDRFSFISDLEDAKDGVDITVGTQHLGQDIARAITGGRSAGGSRPTRSWSARRKEKRSTGSPTPSGCRSTRKATWWYPAATTSRCARSTGSASGSSISRPALPGRSPRTRSSASSGTCARPSPRSSSSRSRALWGG